MIKSLPSFKIILPSSLLKLLLGIYCFAILYYFLKFCEFTGFYFAPIFLGSIFRVCWGLNVIVNRIFATFG